MMLLTYVPKMVAATMPFEWKSKILLLNYFGVPKAEIESAYALWKSASFPLTYFGMDLRMILHGSQSYLLHFN